MNGKRLKIGLVISRFHRKVTDRLRDGAVRALRDNGVSKRSIYVVSVPGAFEIPGAAQRLAAAGNVDAIVCLGAVIRGETEHFTFISAAAQQGTMQVMLDSEIPITFGVLTTDDGDQALARSGDDSTNKGYEAAVDAIEMANLYRELS